MAGALAVAAAREIFFAATTRAYARDAVAAGADAYLGKDADMNELAALIGRTTAGLPPLGRVDGFDQD